MSLNIKIALKDTATASIRNLITRAEDRAEMHETIALDLKREWVRHLGSKYLPRDKDGVEFWKQSSDSIESTADVKGGEITANRIGMRLRYYGGEVKPGKSLALSGPNKGKPTKTLAIPSKHAPVGAGQRLRPVNAGLLAFIGNAKGRETVGFLVEGMEKRATRGKNKGKMIVVPKPGGNLMYVLRTITRHKEDKGIIPDDAKLMAVAEKSARDFILMLEGG